MPQAVIPDRNQFYAFLATQPLGQWSAQKQHEIAMGMHAHHGGSSLHAPPAKNDNADLAAALSSMA